MVLKNVAPYWFMFFSFMAWAGSFAFAQPRLTQPHFSGPPPLIRIPEIRSTNGVADLSLIAQFDPEGRPAFYWHGSEVAPTLRVAPGDHIHLHFTNLLPQICAPGMETNTNLHFHGLRSTPTAPGDEVITTNVVPGATITYDVAINPKQAPGLYWYHPHAHGLSSYEVGNGMAGAIVVEGIADELPYVAGLREHIIVLRDIPKDSSVAASEPALGNSVSDNDEGAGLSPCRAEQDATPTINGHETASIGIRPGETQLFRVVNASPHRHFNLAFDGLPLRLIAQDGVPILDAPGHRQSIITRHLLLPPAGRVEFLITGVQRPVHMRSLCYNSGPNGDANPAISLGVLRDDTSWPSVFRQQTGNVPGPIGISTRKDPYDVLPDPVQIRTISFQEERGRFYINGSSYTKNSPVSIIAKTSTVEEWTVENDTNEVHAFHIHQVNFLVQRINGQPEAVPHWYDTIDVPPQYYDAKGIVHPGQVQMLMDFRDPVTRGVFVYHCHILDHEDGGMMAKIQVL